MIEPLSEAQIVDILDDQADQIGSRPVGFTLQGNDIFEGLDPFKEGRDGKKLRELVQSRTFDAERFAALVKDEGDEDVRHAAEYNIRCAMDDVSPLPEHLSEVAQLGIVAFLHNVSRLNRCIDIWAAYFNDRNS